ncbi:hypothetical protein LX15_002273 [Streptoalloteichus tenebrarius]|uniref:Uncharacterized protein n=1 Tax=Streptoalloteichus tenebrarius (strain ATCC 17920 / DSM 40477 / JCM 4838 / CBS 697.72 / NBRC 16177 / NCIMB 11028 / NRRL B-12390 / A12253. 1 / ISP 5477) TaxID=1933 RepID=A0ABT1HT33_STRSD|nr:hypothetical protein [Streptoalloteichus tenebrarius]MCP2258575.1 hypothetical protein [Streptoalloteichus tenebrarius]BFF04055.1 hypothetical protein GCM10020241_57300 [Streptoalloteichus tenebrarius]
MSDQTPASQSVVAPPSAVNAARRFVAEHGKTGRAVVQYLGRKGARVTMVGEDGALGDVVVKDVATGEAVVAAVEGLELTGWDRETTAQVRIGPAHRHRMAGR